MSVHSSLTAFSVNCSSALTAVVSANTRNKKLITFISTKRKEKDIHSKNNYLIKMDVLLAYQARKENITETLLDLNYNLYYHVDWNYTKISLRFCLRTEEDASKLQFVINSNSFFFHPKFPCLKMNERDSISKLRTAINDYESLVEEQKKQAEQLKKLIVIVQNSQRDSSQQSLEQQFSAIRTHEDLCSLDDLTMSSIISLSVKHISEGLVNQPQNDQEGKSRMIHAILLIWDSFHSRNSIFHSLPPQSIKSLREAVLHPNFAALASPVLTATEAHELEIAVQFL